MKSKEVNWGLFSKYRCELMGIACLWVVFHHFQNSMLFPESMYLFSLVSSCGNVGVDIFLFLSGIGLYFSFKHSKKVLPFYTKRIFKIIVPYVMICVPYFIWLNVFMGKGQLLLDITQASFPLQGMITTWYIPAIVVFYLLFPLIYKIQHEKSKDKYALTTIIMCAVWGLLLLVIRKFAPEFYGNTEIALTRFVIFIIGCAVGRIVYEKKPISTETVVASAVFIIFYCVLRATVSLDDYWIRFSYIPFSIAVSILFVCALYYIKKAEPVLKFLKFFGERSLEIYLTHILLNNIWYRTIGARHFDTYGFIDYAIIVGAAIVLSVILHFIIEKMFTHIFKNEVIIR